MDLRQRFHQHCDNSGPTVAVIQVAGSERLVGRIHQLAGKQELCEIGEKLHLFPGLTNTVFRNVTRKDLAHYTTGRLMVQTLTTLRQIAWQRFLIPMKDVITILRHTPRSVLARPF